jgi:hypothetical protein
MHPPPFRLEHRLSDWPDCRQELNCCRGLAVLPVRMLIRDRGDRTFAEILPRLRCSTCGRPPAQVNLCAEASRAQQGCLSRLGHRTWGHHTISSKSYARPIGNCGLTFRKRGYAKGAALDGESREFAFQNSLSKPVSKASPVRGTTADDRHHSPPAGRPTGRSEAVSSTNSPR